MEHSARGVELHDERRGREDATVKSASVQASHCSHKNRPALVYPIE